MSSVASLLGDSYTNHPLKERFLKWQCHCRQLMMRDNMGRPDNSIMPDVLIEGSDESMGAIITILNKLPGYSETPEMLHMARKLMTRRSVVIKPFNISRLHIIRNINNFQTFSPLHFLLILLVQQKFGPQRIVG